MNKYVITDDNNKLWVCKDNNNYTLTTDPNKACVFETKSKADSIYKSSLSKIIKNKGVMVKTVKMQIDADLATDDLKKSVRKAGNTVRKDIAASAPKDTGAYAKSWSVKKTKETSNTLELTVHSKNRYQLAHLLEHGHAKRGGGRVAARPHIAQAEENAIETLETEIARALGGM